MIYYRYHPFFFTEFPVDILINDHSVEFVSFFLPLLLFFFNTRSNKPMAAKAIFKVTCIPWAASITHPGHPPPDSITMQTAKTVAIGMGRNRQGVLSIRGLSASTVAITIPMANISCGV